MTAQPSRFHASPAKIDAFLREHFAEDALLNFYRAVGDEVLDDIRQTASQFRARKEMEGAKYVYLAGISDVMEAVWDNRYYPGRLPDMSAYNRPFNQPRETGHANHVHAFDTVIGSWPDGPDGETAALRRCGCGATRTDDALGSRVTAPVDAPTIFEWGAAKARQADGHLPERPCGQTASHPEHAHRADRQFFSCPGIPEAPTPCYIKKAHEPHEWLKGRRKLPCPGFPN